MTLDEFAIGMNRLERIFNGGVEIDEGLRKEYFEALQYVDPTVFRDAVQLVVETFKPFPLEPFPGISTIEDAIMETRDRASSEAGWESRRLPPPDAKVLDYCQRCHNLGLFLAEDGQARFCQCEKGRLKRASWGIDAHVRKRDEKIQKALERIPSSLGPVRGLQEWNPLGFWEDSREEHDRWMARKRAELIETHARADIRDRRLATEKRTVPRESLRRLVEEKIDQVQAAKPEAEREPGEDEEEVPF
jgi:hypothetical protein